MASLLMRVVQQKRRAKKWLTDASTMKSYTDILTKPPARRTLKDLEIIFEWFSNNQAEFYKSLGKNTTARNAVLFELCRHVRLINVSPETVLIRQGERTSVHLPPSCIPLTSSLLC